MTDETFDQYCDRKEIRAGEEPAAFAAYLHEQTGWDGQMGEVTDGTADEAGH